MGSSSGSKSSQARLREALTAGNPTAAKGPPVADGALSTTPDTAEAIEWMHRESVVDTIASNSSFLDDDDDVGGPAAAAACRTDSISRDAVHCTHGACTPRSTLRACFRLRRGDVFACPCLSPHYIAGPSTHYLYGQFTWQLDKFSASGKRELRSDVFQVGSFKW